MPNRTKEDGFEELLENKSKYFDDLIEKELQNDIIPWQQTE